MIKPKEVCSTSYGPGTKSSFTRGLTSTVDEGPRALLDRMVDGDPLGMKDLVRDRLAERCLLWDAEAICVRALALCAHRTVQKRRRRMDRQWLLGAVDLAIEQLALGQGIVADDSESSFELFGLPLGFDGEGVAGACLALNLLDFEERRSFRLLVILGLGLDEVARELGRDGSTVGRGARRALDVFFEKLVTPAKVLGDH
jgi:hypothetical protein